MNMYSEDLLLRGGSAGDHAQLRHVKQTEMGRLEPNTQAAFVRPKVICRGLGVAGRSETAAVCLADDLDLLDEAAAWRAVTLFPWAPSQRPSSPGHPRDPRDRGSQRDGCDVPCRPPWSVGKVPARLTLTWSPPASLAATFV